jgi:flagellar basal body-associated protein FliL
MPVWGIVLLVIFVILLAVFIGLMIFGNKLRKQQDEQQAQIDAAKQVMSMLIIDKKKMKLKDANLPKMVLNAVYSSGKLIIQLWACVPFTGTPNI